MLNPEDPPKKICILRLSAIGDVTHVIPVITAIQRQWPAAEITWICGSLEHKLLHILPDIKFITVNKKRALGAYLQLWRKLAGTRFDVLLHMQTAARANIASMGIKADLKLGWDRKRSRDLHQFFISQTIPEVQQQHQVQAFLSFARAIGLSADQPEWRIPLTPKARQFADKYIEKDKKLLVIAACSSHPSRNWLANRYARIGDYAIDRYGMQVILSGGPSDLEAVMAKTISTEMKHRATNLVGLDTLEQLTGLLSNATVVLSPDSGPAHLANAFGVPVIGLYACTRSSRSGPYGSLQYCVDKFEIASVKFLNKKSEELPWGAKIAKSGVMELISSDEVCGILDRIMDHQNFQ